MKANREYPEWFLWMWEKGAVFFIVGGFLLASGMLLSAIYLDNRLDQMEKSRSFIPPRSYETPNLDDYSTGNVDVDALAVQQWVYVPIYSHVYYQGGAPFSLETTLSIRNTDSNHALYIMNVDYFDTSGKALKKYLDRPIMLSPLQSIEFLVESKDSTGGAGANFLVEWRADLQVDRPLVEAIMVGSAGSKSVALERSGTDVSGPRNMDSTSR